MAVASVRRIFILSTLAVVASVIFAVAWLANAGMASDPAQERAIAERLIGRALPASAHDVAISHEAGIDTIAFARFTASRDDADAFVAAVVEDLRSETCPNRRFDVVEAERLAMPELIPPCTPFYEGTYVDSGVTVRLMRLDGPDDEATLRFVAFTQ